MASRKKTAAASVASKKDEKETPTADHGVKDVKTMLSQLNDWGDTEERDMSEVPDGKYQVKIDEATVNSSKASARLQVSWQLTIVSGPQKNRKIWKHDGLDTPENRGWFRGGLARLGIEWPASPKDLPAVVDGLKGTFAQITAKTKDGADRQNVYFDKSLDKGDIGESAIPSASAKKTDERPAAKGKTADPDERPAKTSEPAATDAAGDGNDGEMKVDMKFTDDDMTPRQIKAVEELAKKKEYDLADYSSRTDLLADIAENEFGAEGVFDNPQDLINVCVK